MLTLHPCSIDIVGFNPFNRENLLGLPVRNGSNATEPILQEFVYHPTEERILLKRTYNSTNTLVERVIYLDENFVRVINTSGTYDFTYVKHNGQLVAQLNPDSSKYYIHGDHLGSSSVVTNQAGAPIENTTYSPFGEVVSGGNLSRFDYEGKEFDSLVGDYDFNFRKYKPEWALFLQPDFFVSNIYDPQLLNRYMFERGNSYRYTDPTGKTIQGGLEGLLQATLGGLDIALGITLILGAQVLAIPSLGSSEFVAALGVVNFIDGAMATSSGLAMVIASFENDAEEDRLLKEELEIASGVEEMAFGVAERISGKKGSNSRVRQFASDIISISGSVVEKGAKGGIIYIAEKIIEAGAQYVIRNYSPGGYYNQQYSVSYATDAKSGPSYSKVCQGGNCFYASKEFGETVENALINYGEIE